MALLSPWASALVPLARLALLNGLFAFAQEFRAERAMEELRKFLPQEVVVRRGGREVITAVARGMEIQGRLQYAGNQYEPEHLRFHPPGVAGVIGAAVTTVAMRSRLLAFLWGAWWAAVVAVVLT